MLFIVPPLELSTLGEFSAQARTFESAIDSEREKRASRGEHARLRLEMPRHRIATTRGGRGLTQSDWPRDTTAAGLRGERD
jgi:hypothetical protein